jgi:hypothetical protein
MSDFLGFKPNTFFVLCVGAQCLEYRFDWKNQTGVLTYST